MRFRLELRDRNFVVRDILDDEALNLSWSYSRVGGCGDISFTLPRRRFEERALSGEFNLRLYYKNASGTFDLWYQGLVEIKSPNVRGKTEDIEVSGHGYQSQLSRIYLNNITFTSTEASAIVAAIIGTYVSPYTNITAGVIGTTDFTPSSITFNETALSALEKVADIVGSREWGVDASRQFFFKARSSEIGFRFLKGNNITNFQDNQDFTQIINQIYVQGAQVGGTYFTFGPYNDLDSQAKYNLRTEFLQNSSVTTSDVALQLATARLEEKKEVSRRANCELVNYVAQMEATTPIPLFAEISKKVKYGQKKYGTFLYSGIVGRVINRINYMLTNNNSLKISVELGQLRPNIAEQISQLEYNLDQQRSASL